MNIPTWYHNPIVRFFEIVVIVFLALWAFQCYQKRGMQTSYQIQTAAAKAATDVAVTDVKVADSVRAPALVSYAVVRNRTRGNPAANDVGGAADKVIKADSNAIAKRDTAFKKQGAELTLAQNPPGPPRFQAYAEGLYDLAHLVPVIRGGATFRLVGPISASAAGEYAAPPLNQSKPQFRAVIGLRFTF